jgi:hypothetical protein
MAKNEYQRMDPQDRSVRGIEKMYARAQRGHEEDGRPFHQQPQDKSDQHGKHYDNDASGWTRGASGEPSCYREDGMKPTFDHRGKDGYPKKW